MTSVPRPAQSRAQRPEQLDLPLRPWAPGSMQVASQAGVSIVRSAASAQAVAAPRHLRVLQHQLVDPRRAGGVATSAHASERLHGGHRTGEAARARSQARRGDRSLRAAGGRRAAGGGARRERPSALRVLAADAVAADQRLRLPPLPRRDRPRGRAGGHRRAARPRDDGVRCARAARRSIRPLAARSFRPACRLDVGGRVWRRSSC